jgi:hypothetical protein
MPKNNNNSNKQQKSKQHKKDKYDDETFDSILNEFRAQNDIIAQKETVAEKTPLAEALDAKKKEEIRNKLRNAINLKSQMRNMPSKKLINEQNEELKKMMKHPRMTQNILELYGKAIADNPKNKLPTPIDIFANTEQYKIEYYQYILGLMQTMKDKKMNILELDKILDNPYGHYMSTCIGCPLNPFNKTSAQILSEQVTEPTQSTEPTEPTQVTEPVSTQDTEQVESNSELLEERIKERLQQELQQDISNLIIDNTATLNV